ncbi:hypothetical protein CC2G_014557 [Coprinopsis cinerea AmutBmut pab1-1]|nr:hypothetical protein CC2G_014557 [Coprinopsis cinerea AmutBmut pab1-1]
MWKVNTATAHVPIDAKGNESLAIQSPALVNPPCQGRNSKYDSDPPSPSYRRPFFQPSHPPNGDGHDFDTFVHIRAFGLRTIPQGLSNKGGIVFKDISASPDQDIRGDSSSTKCPAPIDDIRGKKAHSFCDQTDPPSSMPEVEDVANTLTTLQF